VRAASGELLAFTDDDCYVATDLVECVIASFNDARVGAVGGRVIPHEPEDRVGAPVQESRVPIEFGPRTFVRPGTVHGCNMSFRRDALLAAGLFDERMDAGTKFGSGGDIEAFTRVLFTGYSGRYDPGPTVRHHHGRRTPEALDSIGRAYDSGRAVYYFQLVKRFPRSAPAVGWQVATETLHAMRRPDSLHKIKRQWIAWFLWWRDTRGVPPVDARDRHRDQSGNAS
jgi:GT2 family glycosyltransferase